MEGSSWLLDGDEGSPTMEPLPEHSQEDARKNERIGELEGLKQEQRTRSNVEALREEQRVANRRLLGEVTKIMSFHAENGIPHLTRSDLRRDLERKRQKSWAGYLEHAGKAKAVKQDKQNAIENHAGLFCIGDSESDTEDASDRQPDSMVQTALDSRWDESRSEALLALPPLERMGRQPSEEARGRARTREQDNVRRLEFLEVEKARKKKKGKKLGML